MRPITPTDIAGHLACAHRTELERQRHAGLLRVEFTPDARLDAMRERGLAHERSYVDDLRARGLRVLDLSATRDPAATAAAMRDGVDAIVQATLQHGNLRGIADVLLRVAPASSRRAYEPLDTKLAAETKAGTLLQLLAYCEMLEALQGSAPAQCHVVTPLGIEHYRVADYRDYYRAVRDSTLAAASAPAASATYPMPVPHCDVCVYWQMCDRRRRADDHLSLVADIQRSQIVELQRQGLTTTTALASAGGLPTAPQRGRAETFVRLAAQARLQVESRGATDIARELLPIEPGLGLCRLPEPSAGDVFLDFEGDPFVAGGLEYLTGFCCHDDAGALRYHHHWALDHAAEKRALEALLDFLRERRLSHPDLHVYHFGAYEPAALRRLCARHDTRAAELDELLRGERFVDLHRVVREAMRLGVESYGLKSLEAVIGHRRELDLRTAGEARCDLEVHLELGRADRIDEALRCAVAAYNRDDCLATAHLRDWLEALRRERVQQGESVPRPALAPTEAQPEVQHKDARIAALREALLRDLPAPEARDAAQHARALLADLVGYFRRESKSAWWEHFRLRELPREEQLGEREMLAELQFVSEQPRRARERSARCLYRFPPQDTALQEGDALYLPRDADRDGGVGTRVGTVAAIDLTTGLVEIKQSDAALRPSAVFRDQVVGNEVLESSLLQFAEHVRDHGFVDHGEFATACSLLLRRPPAAPPLRQGDESTIAATVRLCRAMAGGVLAIQGPPGTGKSFTGAHAIAKLVAAGLRVGVTAVSHKVIDNLLLAVHQAAGASLRLVHKHDEDPPDGVVYVSDSADALAAIGPRTVVGGTAWLWAHQDARARLDCLFVDEAGQMSLAQVLALARAARNLVLLGDPQQLEQPHQGTHPDGAEVAALTHLIGKQRATIDDAQGLFLAETWRLHPNLCRFTSELYYEGRLAAQAQCASQQLGGTGLLDGAGLFLLEVEHHGNQASAREEVDAVVALLRKVLVPGATFTARDGQTRRLSAADVLVIAPYNAQVGALRAALAPRGVTRVGTVDKFQGQEAPLVIYSCTSSTPRDAPRGLTFLYDPHRLNVASSRARAGFVMVASPALFLPEVRTPEQMRQANGMCRFAADARRVRLADLA